MSDRLRFARKQEEAIRKDLVRDRLKFRSASRERSKWRESMSNTDQTNVWWHCLTAIRFLASPSWLLMFWFSLSPSDLSNCLKLSNNILRSSSRGGDFSGWYPIVADQESMFACLSIRLIWYSLLESEESLESDIRAIYSDRGLVNADTALDEALISRLISSLRIPEMESVYKTSLWTIKFPYSPQVWCCWKTWSCWEILRSSADVINLIPDISANLPFQDYPPGNLTTNYWIANCYPKTVPHSSNKHYSKELIEIASRRTIMPGPHCTDNNNIPVLPRPDLHPS